MNSFWILTDQKLCIQNITAPCVNSLAADSLAPSLWHLSSSSLPAIQIPSLCLRKARCAINKSSVRQVMDDKQRLVCVTPAGLCRQRQCLSRGKCKKNKLMVCVSATAAVEFAVLLLLCEETGSWGGSLCGCFGREGWLSAAKLALFSRSSSPCGGATR